MTKLNVIYHRRPVSLEEAVEAEIAANHNEYSGIVESLRDKLEAQSKLMARMLAVQFGMYDDHFSSPEFEPKTDADKLRFILSECAVTEG